MLDECKGEKFEEVISTLAVVVLRHACASRHPDLDLEQLDQTPKEQLIPLIIAYRQSLQQSLQQRRDISQRVDAYCMKLESAQVDIQRRSGEVQGGFRPVDEKDLRHLSDVVRRSWVGDERLAAILLQGRTDSATSLLRTSFESSWTGTIDHETILDANHNNLAAELDERVEEQEKRLKKWKTFYASMKNTRHAHIQPSKSHEAAQSPPCLDFDQHKKLNFDASQTHQIETNCLQPYHASILKNMQEELAALEASNHSATAPVTKSPKDNTHRSRPEVQAKTQNPLVNAEIVRIGDQATVPGSVQEIVPANTATRYEHSLYMDTMVDTEEGKTKPTALLDGGDAEISPSIRKSYQDVGSENIPSSPPTRGAAYDELPALRETGEEEKLNMLPEAKRDLLSILQERTRASLLPFTLKLSSPDVNDDSIADDESDTSQLLPSVPDITAPRGNLLERTRQSMSLLPNSPPKSKGPRQFSLKQSRFSEIFPVDQFETPSKAHARQSGAWSPRSGSSTSRDKLFSEEADYASVFKSRPRIAVSPSLSPETNNPGLESMMASGLSEFNVEDHDNTSSRGPMRHG